LPARNRPFPVCIESLMNVDFQSRNNFLNFPITKSKQNLNKDHELVVSIRV